MKLVDIGRPFLKCSPLFYFSYRALAVKSDQGKAEDEANVNSKRVVADWNVGLGEEASHIQVVPPITKDAPSSIIVLGRRTLYILQDMGVLTFSRKLDFCATSLRAFRPSNITNTFYQVIQKYTDYYK